MQTRQYIVTERAHYMCPNMHFGIKAKIRASFDFSLVISTINTLTDVHPLIKSLIQEEEKSEKLFYCFDSELIIPITKKDKSDSWIADYKELTNEGWNVFCEPLLKVIAYPETDGFEILFIANHLLCDGRSLLGLMSEFANGYALGIIPERREERLIQSIKNLPVDSKLSWISKLLIKKSNRMWHEEKNRKVTYSEYLEFEKNFIKNNPIDFEVDTLQFQNVKELLNVCRNNGVSLNDYLVAELMNKENVNRVVIAADIRGDIDCYNDGSLGNYATAISVEDSLKTDNIMQKAESVSKQIKIKLQNTRMKMLILTCYLTLEPQLIDAAAISTMGKFNSKAGSFIGSLILGYKKRNGYGVTNLGNIVNQNIDEMMFIPPASPANRKTMGVVSVNNHMTKCTVYYVDRD